MRDDDAFWAARRVMAFSDDLIRAVVKTGEIGDEAQEKYLADTLILRRDKIGRAYLPKINPIVDPVLSATRRTDVRQRGRAVRLRTGPGHLHRRRGRASTTPPATSTRIGQTSAASRACRRRRPADGGRIVHRGGAERAAPATPRGRARSRCISSATAPPGRWSACSGCRRWNQDRRHADATQAGPRRRPRQGRLELGPKA